MRNLTFDLILVVPYNLLLLIEFLLPELRFLGKGDLVGSLDFSDESHVAGALLLSCLYLSKTLVFDLASHLLLLLNELLALLDALNLALLNLVDDDKGSFSACILADNLTFFLNL